MDIYTACEQAYKNGYADGLRDAKKTGQWQLRGGEDTFFCSICNRFSLIPYNFCPDCGSEMISWGEYDGT